MRQPPIARAPRVVRVKKTLVFIRRVTDYDIQSTSWIGSLRRYTAEGNEVAEKTKADALP